MDEEKVNDRDVEIQNNNIKTEETVMAETATEETVTEEKFDMKKEIISWIILALLAFLLAKFITNFVIIKAIIPSNSMENTIMTNDRIIGNRLAYLFTSPKRGDIVIFKFPDDETKNYIKRVIGLPGETIEIYDGAVYIYDAEGNLTEGPFEESYLKEEMYTAGIQSFTVPEDCYFMLGDNRNTSLDARYWINPYVHEDKILGKAWFRYRPSLGLLK